MKVKILALIILALSPASPFAQEEDVIDAVIASVDGKPITLQDVNKQLHRPRGVTLSELNSDAEARAALEFLILEKLILHEAEAKKVAVTNSEIDDYINEVAARNKLSREGFEAALMSENKNIQDYKRTLKLEILRSKITSNFVKDTAAVSEEEIDAYLAEHPELTKSGSKIKLRQILIKSESHPEEESVKLIESLRAKAEEGEAFEELARAHSEGAEAADGGSLGVVAEEDLSRDIFDAVLSLNTGEVSKVVKTPMGYHIFMVEERIGVSGEDEDDEEEKTAAVRAEARKILLNGKMQERMQTFFAHEIYKLHTVDKKI